MTQSDSSVEIIPALKYDLNEFEHTTVAEREAAAEAEKAEQEAELAAEQEAKEKEMEEEIEAALKEKEESSDESDESDESDDSGVIEGFDEYIADSGAGGEQYEMVEGTQSNLDELPETGLFSDGDANMMPSILLGVTGLWVIMIVFLREKMSKE